MLGGVVLQIGFKVVMQRGNKGAGDACIGRVVAGSLSGGIQVYAFKRMS